jgi:hypothetical protein
MKYLLIVLYTAFLLSVPVATAQYYDTGQDPASLKWMQIKTGRFTVIYPEKYGSGGLDFARSLDEAYSNLTTLYPEKKFKIPVVIHNFTTQSNGYVAWAPRRMEIYPTPEQNTIPLDPNRQLAIHELAHVFQMESLNAGFSKALTIVFGEQITGVIASLLPLWFMEGDAVFAESVLTESGRGRSPSFQKQLKAIAVGKEKMYKYDKMINESFRDYTPDHYQFGYQMVAWSMVKYDPQLWNKTLRFTADQPFTLNPVNISLSKNAGLTKKRLYAETFDSLKTLWKKDILSSNALTYSSVNPDKRGRYINYYSPVYAGKDSIIAIRTSLSQIASFVLVNPSSRSEKKLHTPGQVYPWFLSYAKGKIVWVENQIDPRWENRNYSVIKLMDIRNKIIRQLTFRSRYMSASVSPDGKTIAAVENTPENINNLIFLESEKGSVIQTVAAPDNVYLQRPQWSAEGGKVTVIFLTTGGEGIMSYSPETRKWDTRVETGRADLQCSILRNDSLFYTSSVSGTENIYLKTAEGKTSELTRSAFGAIDIGLKGNTLIFSDYSSSGNNICITKLSESGNNAIGNVQESSFLINRVTVESKTPENISDKVYSPQPYRKWQHLFKFHSWMPFYADIEQIKSDPTAIRPGVSILTQNLLSTLTSTIGYEYSQEKKHVLHTKVTWKGWYPVFESQLDYGNRGIISKMGETVENPSSIQPGMQFLNTVSLPLRFSVGRFSQYFRPSFTSDYRNDNIYIKKDRAYDFGQTILSGRFYFSNYHKYSYRDIYPKFAQIIDLNYTFAPFDKTIYGTAGTFKTAFYFPGILPNNGIKVRYEKEKQTPVLYIYGNRVPFPRGYKNIRAKEFQFFSVDYVLPVAYPDFNISSLLYLKRIRAGLFYDIVSGPRSSFLSVTPNGLKPFFTYNLTNQFNKESLSSFGLELLADFHLFRIPYMISGGVQTAWKSINEPPSFELLFNIDLYGITIGKADR